MKNKKMIVIPTLVSFRNKLGIQGRKIKRVVFIINKSNFSNLYSLESTLSQLKFFGIVGW
ncbi:MAG: hypothetical protein VB018_03300 [Lachnospiraceae bacterium]|nr:hypothetical protein [Lachnospiraceae bacterium]